MVHGKGWFQCHPISLPNSKNEENGIYSPQRFFVGFSDNWEVKRIPMERKLGYDWNDSSVVSGWQLPSRLSLLVSLSLSPLLLDVLSSNKMQASMWVFFILHTPSILFQVANLEEKVRKDIEARPNAPKVVYYNKGLWIHFLYQ